MKLLEYPSGSYTGPRIFVGKNRLGNWVVRAQNGIFGGLFASREQALKYALRENGQHPEAILEVSREIELDIPPRFAEARGLPIGLIEKGCWLCCRPRKQTATPLCEDADWL